MYAAIAALLLVIEVLIALFVHDEWIRPHGGDVLAVMLVYAALRATGRFGMLAAALTAFAIGTLIEIGQWLHVLDRIGLGGNAVARTVMGTQFEWWDILAYLIGAMLSYAIGRAATHNKRAGV